MDELPKPLSRINSFIGRNIGRLTLCLDRSEKDQLTISLLGEEWLKDRYIYISLHRQEGRQLTAS